MMGYLKVTLFSLVVMGLISGSAFAGSLTYPPLTEPWKVAKEVVEGGTAINPAETEIGGKVTQIEYKPSDIPLGTLSDALVAYTVSGGKWIKKAGVTPQICDTTDPGPPVLIATYKVGDGTNTITFDKGVAGSGSVSNGRKYKIMKASGGTDCNASLASDDLKLTVPPGTTTTTLTTKTGVAATQVIYDTASATLVSVLPEFKASVQTKADQRISPQEGFKKFSFFPFTLDTIGIDIQTENLDHLTTKNAADKTIIKIALTDVSGLAANSVTCNDPGYACNLNLATKIAECSKTGAAGAGTPIFTFNVDGNTVLAERTFTATAEIDFANAGMKDRTAANDFALLKDADAGKWIYDATKVYIPLIGTNPAAGRETYIKLQSSETATVKAIVLASDGSQVVVELGTLTKGVPKTITGAELKDLVTAAGKSVDGVAGFSAILNITAAKENIFGYANIIDPSGAKRVPLSIESGVSN